MDGGAIAFDGAPPAFLEWALRSAPALATPAARLFDGLGMRPVASVREGRRALAARGLSASRRHFTAPGPTPTPTLVRCGTVAHPPSRSIASGWSWAPTRRGSTPCAGSISLSARGERVALMGRNGAGKSTLLSGRGTVGADPRARRHPRRRGAAAAAARRPAGARTGRRRASGRGGAGGAGAAGARRPRRRGPPRPSGGAPAPGAGDRGRGPWGRDGSRPALCCRTSRPAAWTAPARTTCPLSRPSSPGPARRSWSRPTTSSLPPPSPTGSC